MLPSAKELLILGLLADHGELYGLQMVERSMGGLKRGTVYVTLSRMEEKGLVEGRREEPRPNAIGLPRRLYRVTAHGRRALEASELAAAKLALEPSS